MNRRAVSSTVAYVLALAIAAVLISGLLVAGSTFIDDQRERVIDRELDVIAHHVAFNLEQVDRMVRAGDYPSVVRINQSFQRQVTGATYTVRLVDGTPPAVLVNASDLGLSSRVNVSLHTPVQESSTNGADVTIRYDGTNLEVRDG